MRMSRALVIGGGIALLCGFLYLRPTLAAVPAIGPDVIVGDLHQLTRWGSSSGIQAYSVGTVSCNVGDEPLLWHNWDNQRPVIGQNMFRLKDGRFEQVGQSWLKWAFASLNQDFCGDCINPGTSSLLGVNCSDPYSASLNGQQSRLGPKSIVNPFLGDFPADHPNPGSGTIDGRLQVHTEDVDPNQNAGALYFVEGQYVTPDDAAAGNLYNNASWRQIWVNADLSITFNDPQGGTSETVIKEPAITAWRDFDPTVAVIMVDVPDDGRLYLAWTATDLGGGNWRYEFAVQNLNCDRAVGGFVVSLPAETVASNAGFHDVDYHSGEPYDGAPWTVQISSAEIGWNTKAYEFGPNGNALRWGTLYNFRFDADAAPSALTTVELVLFKPGVPTSVVVSLQPFGLGDLNCDGSVNSYDIDGFVCALSAECDYEGLYPECDRMLADVNGDGEANAYDIDGFVALVGGG